METLHQIRDTLISPEELADTLGLSTATLASWRARRQGPAFTKAGRKVWYRRERVEQWLESQERETHNDGPEESRREMGIQIQSGRARVQRNNRLGRHRTKSDQGSGCGVNAPTSIE